MEPINYQMQVLDPIQMALEGYGRRVAQQQADTQLGMEQQRIDMAGQAMQFEQQRAMAEQQKAQARAAQEAAGQQAYIDYMFDPNKTAEKTEAVIRANPQLADAVMQTWQGMNEDQKANTMQFGQQFTYALSSGSTDAASRLLDERIAAAEAAGNKPEADAYRATKMRLDAGDVDGVKADAMVTLYGGMKPDEFTAFQKTLPGAVAEEMPAGVKELEWRAKEAGLEVGSKEYKDFIARDGKPRPANGTTTIGPDGTVTIARSSDGTPKVGPSIAEIQTSVSAATDLIDDISKDKALPTVTGAIEGGGGNNVDEFGVARRAYYGDAGLSVIQKIAQLQNTAWLAARDMLKGGGAITDYESKKAEGAMARLSRAQGDDEFKAALTDLRDAITEGAKKLEAANGAPAQQGGDDRAFLAQMTAKMQRGEAVTADERQRINEAADRLKGGQ